MSCKKTKSKRWQSVIYLKEHLLEVIKSNYDPALIQQKSVENIMDKKPKRRTLVVRIGDHWFLRHFRDLYETLTSKHTTKDQPRGIKSIYNLSELPKIPRFFDKKKFEVDGNYYCISYFKDKESEIAFEKKLDEDAELKIYLAGHGSPGGWGLSSLEESIDFFMSVQVIAVKLHEILSKIEVKPTANHPIKISLIACYAASKSEENDAFAVQLLEELNKF